ncbi:MAG: type II secretion system protein [Burkholderiales bacterium]|nr:type II secretion system protein [Phycisphaerae bacterium]
MNNGLPVKSADRIAPARVFTRVELPAVSRSKREAFTLVELLVVIGIIAVLVGILLPALGRAKSAANTVACSSNMRQVYTAARNYATEFKDSLPFGMAFNKMNAAGRPFGTDSSYITWFSSCDKYMTAKSSVQILLDANTGYYDGATRRVFSQAFKCPAVDPGTFKQQVHYGYHSVAMAHLPLEMNPANASTSNPPPFAPAKFTQLWPDNALFWDAPLYGAAESVTPAMFWVARDTSAGFTFPACHMDADQIADPKTPELRYRGPNRDRFSQSGDVLLQPNGPIAWRSDEWVSKQATLSFTPTYNADYGGGTVITFTINGPRFRHGNKDTCVVVFADGSVRPLKLYKGRFVQNDYYDTEFRRKYIMLKWPGNKQDSGTVPTG